MKTTDPGLAAALALASCSPTRPALDLETGDTATTATTALFSTQRLADGAHGGLWPGEPGADDPRARPSPRPACGCSPTAATSSGRRPSCWWATRDGQDAPGDRADDGGGPAGAQCAVRDRGPPGERAGRGQGRVHAGARGRPVRPRRPVGHRRARVPAAAHDRRGAAVPGSIRAYRAARHRGDDEPPVQRMDQHLPEPRLCRAVVDRLTHRANIIETGRKSIRLEEALTRHPEGPA